MKRRRWPWLVAAGLLIALAAWLMSGEDPERPEPVWRRVTLPRRMNQEEHQRAEKRRTLVVPAPAIAETAAPSRPRDPIIAALPSKVQKGAVVVEANAIRYSPVGQLLIDCITSRDNGRGLARFKEESGIDPLQDLDRVAMVDDTLILTGQFGKANWEKMFPSGGTVFGQKGSLYEPPERPSGDPSPSVGVWDNQMVVIGDTDDQVREVLDRVEGRGLQGAPVIDESQTYGEIYGVLTAGALAKMLPQDQGELARQIESMADRVELHVDTSRDVGVVADITGPNAQNAKDLGKTLGAALALGRMKAQTDGQKDLAELLDLARVVPGEGRFQVELGLPLEYLEKQLRACVERNQARNAARQDAGVAPP